MMRAYARDDAQEVVRNKLSLRPATTWKHPISASAVAAEVPNCWRSARSQAVADSPIGTSWRLRHHSARRSYSAHLHRRGAITALDNRFQPSRGVRRFRRAWPCGGSSRLPCADRQKNLDFDKRCGSPIQ